MDPTIIFFFIIILILSVVIHEVSHGYAANMLGDPTARLAGRLTLNPINHLDMVGSFIVPVIMFMTTHMVFGWAKPVPYNPYNLRKGRYGPAIVALAGPLSNIFIAIVFGLLIRFGVGAGMSSSFLEIFSVIVLINLVLAVFNMIPVPPLDGSKVLFAILPYKFYHIQEMLERYGLFVLLIIIFSAGSFISPIINFLFTILVGAGIPFF
ncbi:site-2 protease family protein [Patescibacteria group bacterium]|nr:site-2 protease family protein [Patescibacteria group bacterium]MBU2416749.1 site-2 protease family protein [Patescibacteria group bacterium]